MVLGEFKFPKKRSIIFIGNRIYFIARKTLWLSHTALSVSVIGRAISYREQASERVKKNRTVFT